jgi:prolyl-tRNA editing enzyme YbaK/EbsC (Cys-tRNA(Pro) deacylase)
LIRRFTVRLTAKELEQMKSVDIGAVAPESLPDVSGMAFDTSLPREERSVFAGGRKSILLLHRWDRCKD